MCDSQADISVIKLSAFQCDPIFDTSQIIKIKGITNDVIYSHGTISVEFFFNDIIISHKFHVVPDEFNIPSEGIIGRDFNKRFHCVMDYGDMTFLIKTKDANIKLNIMNEPEENISILAARCETYRIFHIQNFSGPSLIPAQEISPGIIIPNTIAHTADTIVRVLNTSTSTESVNNTIFNAIPLTNFDIFTINKINDNKIKERNNKLIQYFSKSTPSHVRKETLELCMKYSDIFALPEDKMTTNNFYEQRLRAKDEFPVYVKNYRLPKVQKDEINEQVSKLLANDLIEPSVSPFNSPLILVPKKSNDGKKKWRMCVDYRMLNKQLIADKYPLPRIDEILDNLGRAKYFSIVDLQAGFWQIPIEKNSREMTAFSTEKGAFQWKVLPFGLNIAPNSFSRMMAIAFSGLPPENAFIYMDDLVVIGCSIKHHLDNLENVFKVCRKYNLRLNPEKCEFFRPEVSFLGHTCTEHGIKPDSKKLHAIENYPKPTDKESTKRFAAFANYYRRFIKDFADIVRPLNRITRKKTHFEWTNECDLAFYTIRDILKSPTVLAYPDFSKPFRVTVDASTFACGAVLSQLHGDEDRPIAYISKAFKKGELNKPIIEKELMAIHFAITSFRPYIYGTQFDVMSDHRPLVYLYGLNDPSSKLTRIRLELEEYNFTVHHIKGKDNVVADALSRITFDSIKSGATPTKILVTTRAQAKKNKNPDFDENNNTMTTKLNFYEQLNRAIDTKTPRIKSNVDENENLIICAYLKHKKIFELKFPAIAKEYSYEKILMSMQQETAKRGIKNIQWPKNDLVMKNISTEKFKAAVDKCLNKLCIVVIPAAEVITDIEQQLKLIKQYHDDPLFGGHMGKSKMYEKLRSRFYWKSMNRDIAKYVQSCTMCHLNKPKTKPKVPMKITYTPQSVFDTVIVDTIGPLPKSDNNNVYAVTMICDFSKYLISVPIPNKEANTVAKAIFEHFILIYGIMKQIRSDCGTEYKNEIIKCLCKMLNINHNFSTPYRHESVGSIERNHRFFNQYIRSYVSNVNEWESYLKYFTFCYNTSPHSSFNDRFTPFELVFSKKANLPNDLTKQIEPLYNIDNYALQAKYKLQKAYELVNKLLVKAKTYNKTQYDKNVTNHSFNIDDLVYIQNEPYDKKKNVNVGPFIIKSIDNPNVTLIDPKTNKMKTVHMTKLRV